MDKRRTAYVLPYATKYEVNSIGEIWKNTTEKEMTVNEKGLLMVTTDEGTRKWIHPLNEFNSLHYDAVVRHTAIDLGPEFPGYYMMVENYRSVIYSKHIPGKSLVLENCEYVRMLNYEDKLKTRSIYKLLAIFGFGHKDPSPEYVQFLKRQLEDDEVTLNDIKYRTKEFYENVNPVVPVVPLEKPSSAEWVTWHKPRPVNYGNWVIEDGFENDGEAFTIAFTDPETDETVVLSID